MSMVKSAVALGPRAQGPCCTQQATRLGPRATMQGGSHHNNIMCNHVVVVHVGNNPLDGRQTHVCIFCWQGGTVKEQIVCDSKILICYIVILITIFLILHMFAHPLSLHLSIHRKIDVPFFVLLSLATTYSWFLSKNDTVISFCL